MLGENRITHGTKDDIFVFVREGEIMQKDPGSSMLPLLSPRLISPLLIISICKLVSLSVNARKIFARGTKVGTKERYPHQKQCPPDILRPHVQAGRVAVRRSLSGLLCTPHEVCTFVVSVWGGVKGTAVSDVPRVAFHAVSDLPLI